MNVDGECHCGAIAYTATVDPGEMRLCHCKDCQTLAGAPFIASVPAQPGTFKLTRGEPKLYVKTADSGRKRVHGFCDTCGTRLFAATPDDTPGEPRRYSLRIGAIKQRAQFKPKQQIWCSSALPWAMDIRALERVEGQP